MESSPLVDGSVTLIEEHGEPYGIRDGSGFIVMFNPVFHWSGQEMRYRVELSRRKRLAELLLKTLREHMET